MELVLVVIVLLLAANAYFALRNWRVQRWLFQSQKHHDDRLLHIGRQREQAEARVYLERLLELEPGTLPPLGGFAAGADMLVILAERILIARPRQIVEFGCGASTLVAARALQMNGEGHLISFDHDEGFADVTRARLARMGLGADLRAVPLGPVQGYRGQFYQTGPLPEAIDIIVVDGPPMALHAETRGGAAPTAFAKLRPGGWVLLDDASRPGERAVLERWRSEHPEIDFTALNTGHGLAIGIRREP